MSLPPEKASELKQLIHQQLSKMDVHGRIREILAETIREELAPDQQHLSTEDLIKALRRRGIIDDVMKELNFVTDSVDQELPSSPKQTVGFDKQSTLKKTNVDPTRRYLYLQVLGGKAFLEHLQEPEPLPGQICSTFTLCLHYRNQRFRSKPVPCACEPDFHDGFLLEVHRESLGDGTRMADSTTMLSISDPIHMVLIKTDIFGETTLVASYFLEWRSVLGSENGVTNLTVELMGVGTESKVSVGILNIKLEMYPPLCASTIDASVTSNEIEMQLRLLVSEHRKDLGLTTVWEDQLSYLLSPALASYEFERTTSISAGNEEFQDAIRRAVPDGHTFKGFPIHFVYRNARRAFATCLRSPFCEEIICCRGDQVRLAVRVRVFTYPESACAVWIMFACKYRSVL